MTRENTPTLIYIRPQQETEVAHCTSSCSVVCTVPPQRPLKVLNWSHGGLSVSLKDTPRRSWGSSQLTSELWKLRGWIPFRFPNKWFSHKNRFTAIKLLRFWRWSPPTDTIITWSSQFFFIIIIFNNCFKLHPIKRMISDAAHLFQLRKRDSQTHPPWTCGTKEPLRQQVVEGNKKNTKPQLSVLTCSALMRKQTRLTDHVHILVWWNVCQSDKRDKKCLF